MPGPDFRGQGNVLADGVGIGTPSPTQRLHVYTDQHVIGYGYPAIFEVDPIGIGNAYVTIKSASQAYTLYQTTSYGNRWWLVGSESDGTSNIFRISSIITGFVGDRVVRLAIDGAGNVGIGTPNPSEKLEVNGNVKVAGNGTFGGATTQGLFIGNGRIFAFADQGNPSRLDIANGVVQIIGDAPDVNGGVYIRIKSAAEGGQGAFRVRNMGNTADMLRVTAAGDVYVNEVKAINAQGQCLYG